METKSRALVTVRQKVVPSLPTRNGNIEKDGTLWGYQVVPSLPTRNGNGHGHPGALALAAGSQPTYKEWKPGFVDP